MNIFIYLFIFFSKVLENTLGTLRLLLVSNGKKMFGAILGFTTSLVWIISTGLVVVNIDEDYFRIIIFCIGTFVGSYIGSFLEEKLAIGSSMLLCIVSRDKDNVTKHLRDKGIAVTVISGTDADSDKNILIIMTSRKKIYKITEYIKSLNNKSVIISESATLICGDNYKV